MEVIGREGEMGGRRIVGNKWEGKRGSEERRIEE